MSDVRRISEFLPEVLQTDVLRKFFAATADHMFQPDRVEYLNAYEGQLPSTYNPTNDARNDCCHTILPPGPYADPS